MDNLRNIANTAFGSKSNDSKDVMSGQTPQTPPYVQFVDCRHATEYNCKYKDINGKCTLETCVMDNDEVPKVNLQFMECQICGETYSRDPKEEKVPFCDSCMQRMRKAEELPHNCIFCGKEIDGPAKLMFSGICDDCANVLQKIVLTYKKHGDWPWCRH